MNYRNPSPPGRAKELFPDARLLANSATFEDLNPELVGGCSTAITASKNWCRSSSLVSTTGEGSPRCGVALVGDTGTGKTHMLTAASRYLSSLLDPSASSSGYRVLLLGEVQLRTYLRACWSNGDSADRLRNAIAGRNRSWLFLDDLGAARGDERFALEVADLLQRRYSSPFSTLTMITTNLSLPQLEVVYGPRVASRLYETMLVYRLEGDDQRSPR